jgi:hypothetical protein
MTCKDDSVSIIARMYAPDDGRVRPEHVVLRYMEERK